MRRVTFVLVACTSLVLACGDPEATSDPPAPASTAGAPAGSAGGGEISDQPDADIVSVLKQASERGFTGTVAFDRPGITKAIYFQEGKVIFATSTMGADRLTNVLVRRGKLTEEQVRQAKAGATEKEPLPRQLIELGFLTQEQMLEGIRLQFTDIVLSLDGWPGTMRFRPGEIPEAIVASAVPLATADLLAHLQAPATTPASP